jgi:SAM-dependent methyltransferase
MAGMQELEVPRSLERGAYQDRSEWLRSADFAVKLLCETIGRRDLEGIDVLDVGCGTKVVKVLLDKGIPVGHDTGVDAAAKVTDWLDATVTDPRFDFCHLDARNEMYNPDGVPLEGFERLPVGDRRYDLICLFSVFTHLDPADFRSMLRLLHHHAKQGAKLLFSLYLTRPDGGGIYLGPGDSPPGARFVDELSEMPLGVARYDEDYALELIAESGWRIESLNPPSRYIQHYVVARP